MSTVEQHYANHLAPIYLWMAGGAESALQAGRDDLAALDLTLAPGCKVADLGAGFGMHAIPLAERGYRVTALDRSELLLGSLEALRGDLAIETVHADLLDFRAYLPDPVAAIFCMGDTLTHLPDFAALETLIARVAAALLPGGAFVATFRDYSTELVGDRRFIPVRADADRILTCFLEYRPDTVLVHDILHERELGVWRTRVSHYPKLRLSGAVLVDVCAANGLAAGIDSGSRGMVRLVAGRL
ncbi:hypothetical protein A1507_13650 [Methylomonas koyamae]|uniref:Methyltransferase domain-containing protein n=1 Tax=Methylomonas koyamae TaxID=702114 RepID=A0A177NFN2_9GAMM|nr:class I SAM-dependent methyltransferase [Methylomonas koyamae]OAI15860.1 hypothetical protein A1507_13650 [Methylomonas koyamae]